MKKQCKNRPTLLAREEVTIKRDGRVFIDGVYVGKVVKSLINGNRITGLWEFHPVIGEDIIRCDETRLDAVQAWWRHDYILNHGVCEI